MQAMEDNTERMHILELIENGQISAAEGLRLLEALQKQDEMSTTPADRSVDFVPFSETVTLEEAMYTETAFTAEGTQSARAAPASEGGLDGSTTTTEFKPVQPEVSRPSLPADSEKWKRYWTIPLWIGVGITILSALGMNSALQSGAGFWIFCSSLWLIMGVIVIVLAVQSRTAHWLHLRVQQPPGERPQRIAISFPIPIGLAGWFFRTFRHRIPSMENVPVNIDDLLVALRDGTSPDNPIYIQVDEDDGEKVEIFIG